MFRRFAAAWRFLTVVPLPFSRPGDDELELLRRSPSLFPAVGLAVGGLAFLFGLAFAPLLPPAVAAVLAAGVLAAFSGGLHLDGLADSADALLSATHDREKSLAIMKDSRIGAHGAMALVFALMVKIACLASLAPERLPWVLLVAPVAGRSAMLFPMALLPYARDKGLGALFEIHDKAAIIAFACLWTGCGFFALASLGGLVAGGALWLASALGWVWFLRRRLGGATGDAYGAACEFGEMTVCLAAAFLFRQ